MANPIRGPVRDGGPSWLWLWLAVASPVLAVASWYDHTAFGDLLAWVALGCAAWCAWLVVGDADPIPSVDRPSGE